MAAPGQTPPPPPRMLPRLLPVVVRPPGRPCPPLAPPRRDVSLAPHKASGTLGTGGGSGPAHTPGPPARPPRTGLQGRARARPYQAWGERGRRAGEEGGKR